MKRDASASPPQRTRATIPDEVKAAALADLVFMAPAAVAAKYGLKRSTVNGWKSLERPGSDLLTMGDATLISVKKQRIGALMLEYLEASLNALAAQAYVTSDPNYIAKQPADQLAILHGVIADKSIRLVEALHRSEGGDPNGLDQ